MTHDDMKQAGMPFEKRCSIIEGYTKPSDDLDAKNADTFLRKLDRRKKAKLTKIASVQTAIETQRQSLLDEAQHSIAAIEKILLAFVKNQQSHKKSETSRIRQELEAQLEISERVKQRMESWSPTQSESQL